MKTTKILHLALMAALAFPLGANAALIIDNGDAVAGGGSGTSDLDAISTGGIYQEIADDFTLSAALSLTDISWSGAYTPSNQANAVPDDFTIRVLDNAFGMVASVNVGAERAATRASTTRSGWTSTATRRRSRRSISPPAATGCRSSTTRPETPKANAGRGRSRAVSTVPRAYSGRASARR